MTSEKSRQKDVPQRDAPHRDVQHREDVKVRIMHLLEQNPNLSQRDLAERLGVSLGGVNYCLRAMIEVGQVKIKNFQLSNNKFKYAYFLTPAGVAEKSKLTLGFLRRKVREYEAIRAQILEVRPKGRELTALRAEFEAEDVPHEPRAGAVGKSRSTSRRT